MLPATHLLMEESPNNAAKRITHEWAGLDGNPRFVMIQSHIRRCREGNHWDLCFVYELIARRNPKLNPWWSEMRFIPFREASKTRMGRGHKDVLKEAGYF